jgi:peptidylamidoglycolate lyase
MISICNKVVYYVALLIVLCTACVNKKLVHKQEKLSIKQHYEWVKNWPQLPDGYKLGQVTGVGVDTNQHIVLFHRAGRKMVEPFPDSTISLPTILILDKETGKIINSFGTNVFIMPHGLTVDHNNNIWVTDIALHQIFKFSYGGTLLKTLGTAKTPGNDAEHFNKPTDVAIANDGSFYVSDGYNNNRIIKFSNEGKYLFEWGKKGNGEGEFNIPHSIDLDAIGNVYVADRENNRIQQFSGNGSFIKQWKNDSAMQLFAVAIHKKAKNVYATDYITKGSDILQFNNGFHLHTRFGKTGHYDGPACKYHDISVDNDGCIYVGDIIGNTIQKFKRVAKE